jgi:hypothetical protein
MCLRIEARLLLVLLFAVGPLSVFSPAARAQGQVEYIPFGDERISLSIFNSGVDTASIALSVLGPEGIPASGLTANPLQIDLGSYEQRTLVLADEFGVRDPSGWVRLESDSSFLKATLGVVDSGGAISTRAELPGDPSSTVIFPDVGGGSNLYVHNTSAFRLAFATLRVYAADGAWLGSWRIPLPAGGSWSGRIGNLLPGIGPARAHAVATSSGTPFSVSRDALVGFGIEAVSGTTVASAGVSGDAASSEGYLVHVAQGGGYDTTVRIVNPSTRTQTVALVPVGMGDGDVVVRTIPRFGALEEDLESLFGIASDGPLTAGAVRFESLSGGGLVESAITTGGTIEVVPPSTVEASDFWFVGTSPTEVSVASAWVGLAMLNPYALPIVGALDLLDANGAMVRRGLVHLAAGERRAFLIEEVFAGFQDSTDGAIHLTTSRPVHAIGIWGTDDVSEMIRLAAPIRTMAPLITGFVVDAAGGAWLEASDRDSAVGILPFGLASDSVATLASIDPSTFPLPLLPSGASIAGAVEVSPDALFGTPFKIVMKLTAAFEPGADVPLWRFDPASLEFEGAGSGVTDFSGRVLAANVVEGGTYIVLLNADERLDVTGVTPLMGDAGTTVTVTGSGFLSGAEVRPIAAGPEGTDLATTGSGVDVRLDGPEWTSVHAPVDSLTDTELTFTVPEGAVTGPLTVRAGGRTSNGLIFTVPDIPPSPVITAIGPDRVVIGATGVELTVEGTGFIPGSIVEYDGAATLATFVDVNRLRIRPENGEPSAGRHTIVVRNPAPGGASAPADFFVLLTRLPVQEVTTTEDNPVDITIALPSVGDAVTLSVASDPDPGSLGDFGPVSCNGTCSSVVTYTPDSDHSGSDSFEFLISDGVPIGEGRVEITIEPVNDDPDAVDDVLRDVPETTVANLDVLANDSDAENDPLTITGLGAPLCGVAVSGGASIDYTANSVAADCAESFTYTISDGNGGTGTATVTLTVTNTNDPPTANDDAVGTNEDTPVTFDPRANDTDPDTDPLTITDVSVPANGVVVINGGGVSVTYTPDPDFNGVDTFTTTIDDGNGGSDTATVTVTVAPVNDPPDAVDDALADVLEPGPEILDVLANDTDVDGDMLTITATGAALCGVVTNNGTDLTYTPNNVPSDCAESFTTTVGDGNGGSDTATVTFTLVDVNRPPTGVDDTPVTLEDAPLTFDPRANDSDADTDPLTITAVTTPANGAAVINGGVSVTYTPDIDFNGTDTFSYTIDDGRGGTDTAIVTVTVTNVNDAPVGVNDIGATDEDTPAVLLVLANDTDPDIPAPGDTLSLASVGNATWGTTAITGVGAITYTPGAAAQALAAGESLNDSFDYVVQDLGGALSTATVSMTILGVNDAPVVLNESYDALGNTALEVASAASISPGVFVTGSVIDNDSDPDASDTVSATPITAGASANGGVVNLSADGTFDYTPPAGFAGADTFTYQVGDGNGGGTAGTVTVNMNGVVWYVDNTAPGGGSGTSTSRFNTLAAAQAASAAGHTIYVFEGDSTDTGQDAGITLQDGQRLVGSGAALTTGGTFNGVDDAELLAAGNRPAVSNAAGNAVTATNVDVGITGLILTGTTGVAITKDDAGPMQVVVADNVITGTGTGFAARTGAAAGTLELAFDRNTDLAGGGGAAVDIDGRAGGILYVTGFGDNTVDPASGAAGVLMDTVILDADPADADFTGDAVAFGTTTIGDPLGPDPVGGSGFVLTNVTGDVGFTALSVAATGSGFEASGLGTFNAGAGTGLRITTPGAATVVTTAGPAVDLASVDAALMFAALSTSGSATTGVGLTDVSGSVAIAAGSIVNSFGAGFEVTGGSATVDYGGTISKTVGGRIVDIQSRTGGSATFGGTITDTGGTGINIVGPTAPSNVTFNGTVTLGTTATRNTGGLAIDNNGQSASVAFTAGLNVATNGAAGVMASNGGALSINAGTVDAIGGGGTGVAMNGIGSAVTLTSAAVNSAGAPGVSLTNVTGTTTFGALSVVTSGGSGVVATNGGTLNISNGQVTVTSAPALDIDSTTMAGSGFTIATSSGSGTTGIDLTAVSGTLTMAGGSIGTATGTAFNVSGGNAAISYGGSITNNVGRAASITGLTGGSVTLAGNMDETGTGILVQNNTGGTVTFSGTTKTVNTGVNPAVQLLSNTGATIALSGGGLDLDTTTGVGFTATGGGTVTVEGAGNSINSTGTTALNMNGVTVGANKVTFQSIGSAGSTHGIILNTVTNTLVDGVQVTGTGTTDGSGGTIGNKTTRGVEIVSTNNVTLKNMTLASASTTDGAGTCDNLGDNSGCNAAIYMSAVDTVVLDNVDISGTTAQYAINGRNVARFSLANSTATACGDEVNEGCLRMVNTTGTSSITDSNLSFPSERAAQFENLTGMLALTVSGSTFRDTQSSGLGADGLEMLVRGTSNVTLDVNNSSFLRNRTNGLQVLVEDAGLGNVDVTGSTFDRQAGIGIGMDLSASDTGELTFNVIGNPLINSNGGPAFNTFADGNAVVRGRINNNPDIQVGGPSTSGIGIRVNSNESADVIVDASGNTVSNIGFDIGIDAVARGLGGAACGSTCTAGRLDVTFNNNDVTLADVSGLYDIRTQAQDSNTVCANITNNTASAAGIVAYRARTVDATSTVLLGGFNTNAATTWNNNANTPVGSVSDSHNGTRTGGTCRTVSHPLP